MQAVRTVAGRVVEGRCGIGKSLRSFHEDQTGTPGSLDLVR
ncbi:hypothetical protein [Azospirillum endophyticum]